METRNPSLVFSVLIAAIGISSCTNENHNDDGPAATYLRSDASELVTSWQPEMKIYRAEHQNEQAVIESLGLDTSTRSVIDAQLNRVSYTTPTGTVEVFYDEGPLEPFHTLRYQRGTAFQPQTWSSSSELRKKWQDGARVGAEYLQQLTKLTPVVIVGAATDDDYADQLNNGFDFMLAVDSWPLWVDDLRIRVDAAGVYEFATDELPYDASASGTIQSRTKPEMEALLSEAGVTTPVSSQPPIYYGFDVDTATLRPFYLFVTPSGEGGPQAVPMDRTQTEF